GEPRVNVYDAGGQLLRTFLAYPAAFRGGVHIATGDVTGDGIPDAVTAPGPGGGPVVRVWDGATGALVREFCAYDPDFRGGVNVAATRDRLQGLAGTAVVTAPGVGGGPDVRVYDAGGQLRAAFFAYDPALRGGASVAVLPVGTDGASAIVTGAGPGGGPHVKQWEFPGPALTHELFAFDPAFTGGV